MQFSKRGDINSPNLTSIETANLRKDTIVAIEKNQMHAMKQSLPELQQVEDFSLPNPKLDPQETEKQQCQFHLASTHPSYKVFVAPNSTNFTH